VLSKRSERTSVAFCVHSGLHLTQRRQQSADEITKATVHGARCTHADSQDSPVIQSGELAYCGDLAKNLHVMWDGVRGRNRRGDSAVEDASTELDEEGPSIVSRAHVTNLKKNDTQDQSTTTQAIEAGRRPRVRCSQPTCSNTRSRRRRDSPSRARWRSASARGSTPRWNCSNPTKAERELPCSTPCY
jgi:hypothetical protein